MREWIPENAVCFRCRQWFRPSFHGGNICLLCFDGTCVVAVVHTGCGDSEVIDLVREQS
jgi:hypothetical protein